MRKGRAAGRKGARGKEKGIRDLPAKAKELTQAQKGKGPAG